MLKRARVPLPSGRSRILSICAAAIAVVMPLAVRADEGGVLEIEGHISHTANADGSADPDGEKRSLSVDVIAWPDHTAIGTARLKNRAIGLKADMEVDCALVIEDVVVMSGYVTNSNFEVGVPMGPGTAVIFAVRDNGEEAADQISPVFEVGLEPIPELCVRFVEEFGPPPEEILFFVEKGDIAIAWDE